MSWKPPSGYSVKSITFKNISAHQTITHSNSSPLAFSIINACYSWMYIRCNTLSAACNGLLHQLPSFLVGNQKLKPLEVSEILPALCIFELLAQGSLLERIQSIVLLDGLGKSTRLGTTVQVDLGVGQLDPRQGELLPLDAEVLCSYTAISTYPVTLAPSTKILVLVTMSTMKHNCRTLNCKTISKHLPCRHQGRK